MLTSCSVIKSCAAARSTSPYWLILSQSTSLDFIFSKNASSFWNTSPCFGQIWCHPLGHYIMPASHCAESTAKWGWIDHSSLYRWSFLVILALTMTMTIESNRVPFVRVASAGGNESFEHVPTFCVPSMINFHSCLCALRMCSYCHCILHHSCM